MDTLIAGVTAVTMNEKLEVLFGAYLGITDGKIAYIGKTAPEEKPKTIIDGTGMVAMPGLVNAHTHLATSVLRNFVDDASKRDALMALLERQSKMDERSAKAATLLAIAECLRFGITSVSDMYLFPESVLGQDLTQCSFAAGVDIGGIVIIDTGINGGQDLTLGFFHVDTSAALGETHAAKTQHGDVVAVFVLAVLHCSTSF